MNILEKQNRRNVTYINRDFIEFRQGLFNFIKTYFPNTYNDFNESDPMTMTIELMSYVGDVLSFYTDQQLRESLINTVEEKINLYNLAQTFGYKVRTRTPAQCDLDIYQIVPAVGMGSEAKPDLKYSQIIQKNMIVRNVDGVYFRTIDDVNFKVSGSNDPLNITVHSLDDVGNVEYYLLRKKVRAISGRVITREYEFGNPRVNDKITLPENDVLEVVSITDSDENVWYNVPYLAQDTIPIDVRNVPFNNKEFSKFNSSVPYLLCYRQIERRFVTRYRKDDRLEIQFGSGTSYEADEEIVPNPFNVGIGLKYYERTADIAIDPKNFLYTRTYGTAPQNTTLTVTYTVGGGIQDNCPANTIQTIESVNFLPSIEVLDSTLLTTVRDSVVVNNPEAAYGGHQQKEIENIRLEAMAHFAAQNRAVTKDDYILRCYSMPVKYGAIAKAYIIQDEQRSTYDINERIPNMFALNLYVLAYNNVNKFVKANNALKQNLKNYLSQYRLMTDAIAIKDAHIINIGINFDIITRPNYNSNEVILRCVSKLKQLFSNEKMEINQAIYIANISTELDKLDGVQTVVKIEFECLYDIDSGYSGNYYDLTLATRNNIVYPSIDPAIFEIKYPDRDIKGRVVEF